MYEVERDKLLSYSTTNALTLCDLLDGVRANLGPATPGMKSSVGVRYNDSIALDKQVLNTSRLNGNFALSQHGTLLMWSIGSKHLRCIQSTKPSTKQFGRRGPLVD